MQSRRMSSVEACANLAIGFGINLAGQLLIYPLFGIHIDLADGTRLLIGSQRPEALALALEHAMLRPGT